MSPEHLLKKTFANDSNTLDKGFYNELLHIIGLEETGKGKKLITRKKESVRDEGSLLENTINILKTRDKLSSIENPIEYGENEEEQLFSLSLELCITWLNRILFLKLLEGQIVKYNKNIDKAFLNIDSINDFDEMNELFFEVLALPANERSKSVNDKFKELPYLNSSLFEPTKLEEELLYISSLKGRLGIQVHKNTVVKDNGRTITGKINTLEYLFKFLDAYNFESDNTVKIQVQNKTIINASVLGLIFEKINGYKDGSFYTPGFITMYMCRETIRKAVIQKYNEQYNWNCLDFDSLCNKIDDITLEQANSTFNSIKICDPAVGSGHFLVSALNEMIALKHELKILRYKDENRILKGYDISIVNDELFINYQKDNYIYNYKDTESQKTQVTLFHEKQTIIENCLFGVDINPKSVMICQLRLWIELLKNMYYIPEDYTELQTLPNIDINIKCGNSLVSRFNINDNYAKLQAATKQKIRLATQKYKDEVFIYKEAPNKATKKQAEKNIQDLLTTFSQISNPTDPAYKKWKDKEAELSFIPMLFNIEEKERWKKSLEKISADCEILQKVYEHKLKTLYSKSFEWRFQFPEVLDEDGQFVGFDIVIGNPPYIRQEEIKHLKNYLEENYITYSSIADLYVFFVERGLSLLKDNGQFIYILPNKWMRAGYGTNLRKWVRQYDIDSIVDFGDLPVFENATTYPSLLSVNKTKLQKEVFNFTNIDTLNFSHGLENYILQNRINVDQYSLSDSGWILANDKNQQLLDKIKTDNKTLNEYVKNEIYYGIKTALNEAFVINDVTKRILIEQDPKSAEIIKPFLAGKDIKKYIEPKNESWIILFPKGFTIKRKIAEEKTAKVNEPPPRYGDMPYDDAWEWLCENYSAIAKHLLPYKTKAEKRTDKGDYWWELRACDYYSSFEKKKIVWPETSLDNQFCYVDEGIYLNKTTFFIPIEDDFLLGLLNSKLAHFYFDSIVSKMRGGYFSMSKACVETFPIKKAERIIQNKISKLVQDIIKIKSKNPSAKTTSLEEEIDEVIYKLYKLENEEIQLIKAQTQKQ